MKVKYIGKDDPIMLRHGKIYEVLSIENSWYRVIDEEEEDYLYPPQLFEIAEHEPRPPEITTPPLEDEDCYTDFEDDPNTIVINRPFFIYRELFQKPPSSHPQS
jgi:hypothetical protein